MNQDLPATDSAAELHKLIGEDATATFENDPKFIDSDPTEDASSENLQTRRDRQDVQDLPSIQTRGAAANDEDEEDEDDEDEDDLDDEDEDDDLDDEDLDDEEEEDDDEYVDEDDEDEDDAEDDDEE